MTQTWTIKGQTYTHGQLMEMRKQGLDPVKDEVELKAVTPRKNKKAEQEAGLTSENSDLAEQGQKAGDVVVESANTGSVKSVSELRKLAEAKGMEDFKTAKKKDLLAFLSTDEDQPQE